MSENDMKANKKIKETGRVLRPVDLEVAELLDVYIKIHPVR